MTCPAETLLLDFVDGRLASDAIAGIAEHLHTCTACLFVVSDLGSAAEGTPRPVASWPPFESGRYQIGKEHGRGGLGVVLRAFDARFGREVALKILLAKDDESRRRFVQEATITARLMHPSIVSVLDAGRLDDGTLGYTMPLHPGRSLREAISAQPEREARLGLLRTVLAVCEAVAHAHGRGVMHRDLKPSNVLCGELGETVVIDWGLAKEVSAPDGEASPTPADDSGEDFHTRAGAILGTPSYMPPEQARGEAVDLRADVYALGAILYHVIVGQPPFSASSSAEVLARVLREPPVDVQAAAPGTPDDLAAIVRTAMATSADERYPGAAALADDLRRFLDGGLVQVHAYTPGARLRRWLSRYRALRWPALAAALVVAGIGVTSLRRIAQERRAALGAAASARSAAEELLLEQAESVMATDPSMSIAWLKEYPEDGPEWARVRAIAAEAVQRGLARQVIPLSTVMGGMGLRPDGKHLATSPGGDDLRLWDLETGRSRGICTRGPITAQDPTSFAASWMGFVAGDDVKAWQPETNTVDFVDRAADVGAIAISGDGRWVVTSARDGALRAYDRRRGTVATIGWQAEAATLIAFLPGSPRFALLGDGGRVELWDVERAARTASGPPGVEDVIVDPSGPRFASVVKGGIVWTDADSGETAFLAANLAVNLPVTFAPDGTVLVSLRAQQVLRWDPRRRKTASLMKFHDVTSCASHGDRIACMTQDGVRILDQATSDVFEMANPSSSNSKVLFLPDGDLLGSTVDGSLRVWSLPVNDASTWRIQPGGMNRPAMDIRRDGREMVVASEAGAIWRRPLPEGEPVRIGDDGARVTAVKYLPDGASILVADTAGALSRWSLADGSHAVIASGVPRLWQMVTSADGRTAFGISYHERQLWRWDLATGQARRLDAQNGHYKILALSPDRRHFATDAALVGSSFAAVYDMERDQSVPLGADASYLDGLGFSASGRYVLGTAYDGSITRFDLEQGTRLTRRIHRGMAFSTAAITDDLVVSGGEDRLAIWSTTLGVDIAFPSSVPFMRDLTLSPSGTRLAGLAAENEIFIWDLETRERAMRWGYGNFFDLRWADDEHLVGTSSKGVVQIWDLPRTPPLSPRATHAWLETLTNARVHDRGEPEPACL